jgi:hypothetical protein
MRTLALLLTLAAAALASAAVMDSISHTGVQSDGLLWTAGNPIYMNNIAGGYQLGRIDFSGTITRVASSDGAPESRVLITHPTGVARQLQFTTASYSGNVVTFTGSMVFGLGTSPAGYWNFRYFQSYNDTGVDDSVNINYSFSNEVPPLPQAPAAENLGTLGNARLDVVRPLAAGQVKWFKINLAEAAANELDKYLDIDTEGTSFTNAVNDTELGLYDAWGNLVATDDDDGSAYLSQLSFGMQNPARPAVGNSQAYNGRDGDLFSGDYYLAVAGHNAIFGAGFGVTTNSTAIGDLHVTFGTNLVPEPAALALLALGALLRRR